jgi:hypothetical protein
MSASDDEMIGPCYRLVSEETLLDNLASAAKRSNICSNMNCRAMPTNWARPLKHKAVRDRLQTELGACLVDDFDF